MKVVFTQNIKNVARMGDIKDVADGYARNYLFPRNLAIKADAIGLKRADALKAQSTQVTALAQEEAVQLAQKLLGHVLTFEEEANDTGHLYGSVDAGMIVQKLQAEGFGINEDHIELENHLKTVGEHEVRIRLHPDVETMIKVVIVKK